MPLLHTSQIAHPPASDGTSTNTGTHTGPHVVLNIGYDHMQRETSLSATVAGTLDFLNNYTYNADSQFTQITQQGQTGGNSVAAKLVNFSFDNDGRTTAITRYANLSATQLVDTSTLGYNADSALTSLSEDKSTTNLASYTWSYDHMERLTADTVGTASDSYSYNADSELTAATHSGGGNESYSYDGTGNRTNTGYSTGTNNQLSSDGTYNYLYDANGNMTKKTAISGGAYTTYTWDYRNRLTDVKAYNSSNVLQSHEHYVYDIFDRLIEREVDPTGGGTYSTVQNFINDGANAILVYNGSGALTDRLLVTPLSPGGRGVGGEGAQGEGVLADENGSGTVSWFLKDREGTTNDVIQYNSGTNTTTVVNHIIYSSFGKITSQTNSTYQPLFAYTGQMWDAAASLYYYHARWYDPATGRFISQDPKSFAAGDANLYRYVSNSPSNLVDPSGREPQEGQSWGAAAMAAAMAEMQARAKGMKKAMSQREMDYRIRILDTVAAVKAKAEDGPRDSGVWVLNAKGYYVIKGEAEKVRDAIDSITRNMENGQAQGILCQKLSKLIGIKAAFDVADEQTRGMWAAKMVRKVIPDELDIDLYKQFFAEQQNENTKEGMERLEREVLPGDQIWLYNARLHALAMEHIEGRLAEVHARIDTESSTFIKLFLVAKRENMKKAMAGFTGEEGSNLYWAGNGMVMRIYEDHLMYTLEGYRRKMLDWNSVQYCIRRQIGEQITLEEFGMRERNIPAIPGAGQNGD